MNSLIIEIINILVDEDKEGALNFIKKNIEPALHHSEHGNMKSTLDFNGDMPKISKK